MPRFYLSLIILSACLAGSLPDPVQAQPSVITFDFSGSSDGVWTPLSGSWSVSGGRYRQTNTTGLAVTTLPYTYADVSLETTIDILTAGSSDAWAGFRFFGVNNPSDQTGLGIAITVAGPVIALKDGAIISTSEPIPNPTDSHDLYWEYIGSKSIARLDFYPDVNGLDCDAAARTGLVQLITWNCSAAFDDITVRNRGPVPTATPGPQPTPTLPPYSKRSFYCPAATTGAGGSLLKFWTAGALNQRISSFNQLPNLLQDARRFGSNVVYLVDWWDGGYSNKGDYNIQVGLGGVPAFRDGIAALHAMGGKIVLYLEPFIVHRTSSNIGKTQGPNWAMMNSSGNYYSYYGLTQYYLMYPGQGSGWTQHLSDICGNLARDYGIDGVFLDSYGIQWNWRDYHPLHPNADTGQGFSDGVVDLIQQVQNKMRVHVPHAEVWLEGSEQESLLQRVEGSQIESLDVYWRKAWWFKRNYRVFIAEYDLRRMKTALDSGASLACNDFYFAGIPSDSEFDKMREGVKSGGGREMQQRFWKMVNVAYANGIEVPPGIADPLYIDCLIDVGQYQVPSGQSRLVIPELVSAANAYQALLVPLRSTSYRLPSDLIRQWLTEPGKSLYSTY